MTAFGDMGSQQGIRAVANGVNVGGKFRVYTGSGTPLSTFSATEIGDLYMDYTNGVLYIATATGTGNWEPYTPGTSLKWKQSVKCATTTDGTLATAYAAGQTVDGVTLVAGDRILLKDQTDQTVNGIYTVNATGAPTRAEDASTAAEILACIVPVEQGTVNADSAWVNTNDSITLGSTNITFSIFGGLKAGNGITFTEDVVSIDTAITCDLTTSQSITNKAKLSITSQSAAYNDSALQVGVYGSGIADTLLVDNILVSLVNKSGVNKTAADTSSMTLYVGNSTTAAVTNNKMQGILASSTIAHNMYHAYSVQAHMAVTDDCGTQNANAHVTGVSGKFSVATGKTLATGWGTAGLFIVEGAGAVTQMASVVSLVQEAGCSIAQEMLYINNDGTATKGIYYVGNFTKGIDFSGGTFSQGTANGCLVYGDIGTTKSITPTDSVIPYQCNITSIADSGTSGDETIGATYFRTATSTANQPNHQLATCMVRTKVANNIWDAYGLQSHLSFGNVTVETTGNNAHLTAISGKVTFDTTTVTKGWVNAGLFIIEGAGTCSQICHGVSIVEEAGSTGAQSLLHLNTDVGTTPAISVSAADGTGKTVYTNASGNVCSGSILIKINGVNKYLRFYDAE
jgi:hypothetical protein